MAEDLFPLSLIIHVALDRYTHNDKPYLANVFYFVNLLLDWGRTSYTE